MLENRGAIMDALCELQHSTPSTPITASAAGKDSSAAAIVFDTGGGFTEAKAIFDVVTASTAATYPCFNLEIQGCQTESTWASYVILTNALVGKVAANKHKNTIALSTGRYVKPFSNMLGGTIYRYLRAYIRVLGTASTGIVVGINLSDKL